VWALRRHVAPGDAFFVALAEALDAPLLTTDRRLARAHGHEATIVGP
jgi:predicted nucleic acid-binding protein